MRSVTHTPPGTRETLDGRNPLDVIEELTRTFGPIVRYSTGLGDLYVVAEPEAVRTILSSPEKFPRSQVLTVALGDGLLASEGAYWRQVRRLYQPKFTPAHLAEYTAIMLEETVALAERWQQEARPQGSVTANACREMMRLSLAIIGRTVLGQPIEDPDYRIGEIVTEVMKYLGELGSTFGTRFNAGQNRAMRRAFHNLDRLAEAIIARRRQKGPENDLLSVLMQTPLADTGEPMNDRQLRDEVVTSLLGGHETTGIMMMWAMDLLGRHPDVQQRLLAECQQVLGDRPLTFADLPRLVYTRRFLDEALRLYPPVWSLVRRVAEPVELAGFRFEEGAHLMVSSWLIHRNESLWPEPTRFDPDRFLPEAVAARPRHAYFPFGLGQHLCVGQHFALLEGTVMVAELVRRFRIEALSPQPPQPWPLITIRASGPVPVRLEPRVA
jgi:cytochrome P450